MALYGRTLLFSYKFSGGDKRATEPPVWRLVRSDHGIDYGIGTFRALAHRKLQEAAALAMHEMAALDVPLA